MLLSTLQSPLCYGAPPAPAALTNILTLPSCQPAFITTPHLPMLRTTLLKTCSRTSPKSLLSRSKVPLLLTYARIAAIPVLFLTHAPPPLPTHPALSAALFAFASVTDFLDGYLARLWNAETTEGAFLDPVADKLLVAVALTLIVVRPIPGPVALRIAAPVASATILAREVFVSALREWMAIRGKSTVVKVSNWGKIKTATQMLAVTALLYSTNGPTGIATAGVVSLVVSACLALLSATEYTLAALRAVRQ